MSKKLLGARIAEIRRHRKMQQEPLAQRIGVSRQQVSYYEQGRNEPDAERLSLIALALECREVDLWKPPGSPIPRRWLGPQPKPSDKEAS